MLADLAIVFKLGVRRVCCGSGFSVLAGVLAKISGDLDPFGRVQHTVVEPHLSRFRFAGRHAGLGGGLRARMAARTFPKMLRGTATSANWKVDTSGNLWPIFCRRDSLSAIDGGYHDEASRVLECR